ncbi:MAG: AarF/UbiB family protein [Pseudomonadota bacterium]|nr:MAG: ubiquinone biosynthesis protein UbiB [Pseudomonadota bacterium]
MWQPFPSVQDLGRLHDIVATLIRYGFGDVVRRIGLANVLERAGQVLRWRDAQEYAHMPPPERVRRVLEELGPTFVKLGQLLATRVDLFEPEWIAEFSKLHDHAPPSPYEEVRPQLVEDLGGPPEEVFAWFDPEPLAAASIAQVYRARTHEGDEVVLKVRRPGIRPIVEADLRWMMRLAQLAEGESPELRAFRPQEIVRQFSRSLRNELDLAVEARHTKRIAENFEGYTDEDSAGANPIVIPKIYWQWTSERLCVQEYIDGIAGGRLDAVDAAGLDRKLLARRGGHAVLKMILEDGFFHADPHPGNVFYLPGHRIAFIDFGMVGRVNERRREELVRLLLGLVNRQADQVTDVLLEWADSGTYNDEALSAEIESFVDQYRGVPLKELRVGDMLNDAVRILRQHRLSMPPDLALLIKAFISLEAMGRELDPDFDIAGQAKPVLERIMREHYAPAAVLRRGMRTSTELLQITAGLPRDIARVLRMARRGRLELHVDVQSLRRVGNQLDRAANRLTVGIVIAALIIGSSIVMTVPGGPSLLGLPLFGLLGFLGAAVGGVWLLLSIRRSNREDRLDDQR